MLIQLPEHSTLTVELPEAVARSLNRTAVVDVVPNIDGGWDVRSAGKVGAVSVEGAQLLVDPKVPLDRLFGLLLYAERWDAWVDDITGLTQAEDLTEAMVAAFVHHLERALAQGVLQGYVEREDTMQMLRGRLIETAHMRRGGVPLPLHVRYDEFSTNIPENRLLAGAALIALRLSSDGGRRRRVRHQLARLQDVAPLRPGDFLPDVVPTRLNERYGPALALAKLLLDGVSLASQAGGVQATGYVVDMHVLFEQVLERGMREALAPYGGSLRTQEPGTLDEEGRVPIRPDLTWWVNGTCAGLIDAKYKVFRQHDYRHDDLYQMVAYADVHGLSDVYLVYVGAEPPDVHTIRGTSVRVHRVAVSLGLPLPALLAEVASVADAVRSCRVGSPG